MVRPFKRQGEIPEVPIADKIALTVEEAGALSSFGRNTIYDAMNEGALRAKKRGKRTVILRTALVAWLESLDDMDPAKDRLTA